MIKLDNPLLDDPINDSEGEEVEEMEIKGVLKTGKVTEAAVKAASHVNNIAKLKERLQAIQQTLPWIETLDVTVDLKVPTQELKDIASDNFKQEMLFYKQCSVGAQQGILRLQEMGFPTARPEDFFAEMVKSDDHMKRVKQKLVSKQLVLERTEKVTKSRKMKKLGKKVQHEVLKQRQQDKKQVMDTVKKLRKGMTDQEDIDNFEINEEEDKQRPLSIKEMNRKRKAKESKYGFGGKKKYAKTNTAESYKDISSFSSRIHSKPKKSAKNEKRMAGKPQRPGKNRRAQIKSNKGKKK